MDSARGTSICLGEITRVTSTLGRSRRKRDAIVLVLGVDSLSSASKGRLITFLRPGNNYTQMDHAISSALRNSSVTRTFRETKRKEKKRKKYVEIKQRTEMKRSKCNDILRSLRDDLYTGNIFRIRIHRCRRELIPSSHSRSHIYIYIYIYKSMDAVRMENWMESGT